MSYKKLAKNLIDQIPESKMYYVISYLQGAAIPDEIPNTETLEAMAEVEEMIKNNRGLPILKCQLFYEQMFVSSFINRLNENVFKIISFNIPEKTPDKENKSSGR